MLDYNVPGGVCRNTLHNQLSTFFNLILCVKAFPFWIGLLAGKLNRGLSVIDSYKLLKEGKELTNDEVFLTCTLGWCIEWVWLQNTSFLFWLILSLLLMIITTTVVSLLMHQNFYPILTMSLAASSIFSCS